MKSMTGFGKALKESKDYQIEVEIKSVNHRFLDFQLRLPRALHPFEQAARQAMKEILKRGRIEVFVTLTELNDQQKEVKIHWDLIEAFMAQVNQEAHTRFQTSLAPEHLLQSLLEKEEFVQVQEKKTVDEALEALLLAAIVAAANANDQSRQVEGAGILQVLQENLQQLQVMLAELAGLFLVFEKEYLTRFEKKLTEYLSTEIDRERLLTEMVILLEKSDIHEEIDRLKIHVETFEQLLTSNKPVGRELDFLIQEMNREVNTIGSKSSAIDIKNIVVQLKTTIEKIREQVQNVE